MTIQWRIKEKGEEEFEPWEDVDEGGTFLLRESLPDIYEVEVREKPVFVPGFYQHEIDTECVVYYSESAPGGPWKRVRLVDDDG